MMAMAKILPSLVPSSELFEVEEMEFIMACAVVGVTAMIIAAAVVFCAEMSWLELSSLG